MQRDVEITLTSSSGVLDQELELELEPIYNMQNILDYLQSQGLLRQPLENIVVRKDGTPVSLHVRLHMLIGDRQHDRVRIALETKGSSAVNGIATTRQQVNNSSNLVLIPPPVATTQGGPGNFMGQQQFHDIPSLPQTKP